MKETCYSVPVPEMIPGNKVVVQAEVEDWNRLLAQAFGFPDLIPADAESRMYHIAVGKNSNGDIVGAKLLQETSKDFAIREASLNFLSQRAQLIFGLRPSDYSLDD